MFSLSFSFSLSLSTPNVFIENDVDTKCAKAI